MDTPEKIEKALKWLNIGDVWGIGRKLAAKMNDSGVIKPGIFFRNLKCGFGK
jgi:DNA polymerase V